MIKYIIMYFCLNLWFTIKIKGQNLLQNELKSV